MKNNQLFRPRASAFALEPRVLFDGAAAVAVDDHLSSGDPLVHQTDTTEARTTPAVDATTANPAPAAAPTTLLVVDSRVADYQSLLSDLPANTMVRVISADESGLEAISAAINTNTTIDSIQIISHGSSGTITLGSDTIETSTLSSSSAQLQSWAPHLTANADILLYGCDVGAGPNGTALLSQLADLTGADIAASTDATGAAAKGGDWVLETSTGSIESHLALSQTAVDGYGALLAATSITDANEATPRITAEDTELAIAGLTITDADNPASITLHIQTTGGTARVDTLAGSATISGSNNSADFTISGSLTDVNSTLATLYYKPTLDQNSSTAGFAPHIDLTATDVDNSGLGSLTVSNLVVTAVNDAPSLIGGVTLSVDEDGSRSFTLQQLAPDAGSLDVDIATGQQVLEQQMIRIDTPPSHGTLTYKNSVVVSGTVIPIADITSLTYTHDGTDIPSPMLDSFTITVSDGGGASTTGSITLTLQPQNVAPTISGAPTLIEGQVKVVAPAINLGDSSDTLADSTIVIDNIVTGGQGTFFIDANNNNVVDAGETLTGSTTLDATQRANLSTQLKFSQNGYEPDTPGATSPSYRITVTDAGGGTGVPSAAVPQPIALSILPNNDDPTLVNTHAQTDTALSAGEGTVTMITSAMLQISDADRNPADTTQPTPENQLVFTVGTSPTEGEIQVYVGGGLGYDGDGWITLGDGGRFTQAQVTAGNVRYYQTRNVTDDTLDSFTFTVRDSAFGYDVWTDPAAPTSPREGGLRDAPTGAIATQQFYLNITADDNPHTNTYTGDPRPATSGFGGTDMVYTFVPTGGMLSNNSLAHGSWTEANVGATDGGYVITSHMLSYTITRTDTMGTAETDDDLSVTVPENETVYTVTAQPGNGTLQRLVDGNWQTIPTNGQFTQADIDAGTIRFVDDGSENHTSSFGYTVSDGTPNHYDNTFGLDITPTNDQPTANNGSVQVLEKSIGADGLVRLDSSVLGMSDADLSLDSSKQTGEGASDFLWFTIVDHQPQDSDGDQHGKLERWNGSTWVTVTPGEWLPSTLLTMSADGGTSGLRYAHDSSEPLAYPTAPQVTFQYHVRDDLADPGDPLATNTTTPVPDSSGTAQSNQSADATVVIKIIPVNSAPIIADKPGDSDPVIDNTITNGGALVGKNEILADVPEGGTVTITSDSLTTIDKDNTTIQRQYRLTSLPTLGVLQLNGKTLGLGSTFTQDDIDNNRVTYTNAGAEVGALTSDTLGSYHDKFQFVVSDGVLEDSGAETDHNTFLITLQPANDIPTVTTPASLDVTASGSTPVAVTGVSVDDPDLAYIVAGSEENFIRVEVQVLDSNGSNANPVTDATLNYSASLPTGGHAYSSGKGTATLVIQGTREQVNAALATLTVAMSDDQDSSTEIIRVTVDDRLYDSAGSIISDGGANGGITATTNTDGTTIDASNNRVSKDIALLASNVNDLPTLTNATSYTVNEDAPLQLTGFTLTDADSFNKPVTVKVELFSDASRSMPATTAEGSLTYSGLSNVTANGTGTNTVTLTGTMADVQTALNALTFDNATDYNGPGTGNGHLYLKTTFTDYGHADVPAGHSVSVNNDITIVPVNDAPVLSVPGDQTIASGIAIDISGFTVQDNKDISQGATDYIEVTVAATDNYDHAYGRINILTPGTATVTGDGTATVVVKGTNADVQAALNTLRYTPTDSNVDQAILMTVTADDRSGGVGGVGNGKEDTGVDGNNIVVKTFHINTSSTNDGPVVTAPASLTVAEDTSAVAVAGVSYSDTDDFGGIESITLSVSHGSVNLTTRTGLTVIAGGYDSATVTLEGTKTALNNALATLKYTPTANYHGSDILSVTADDKGLVGTGGAQNDSKDIDITVTAVNDQPTASNDVTLTAIDEDSGASPAVVIATLPFGYSDSTDDQRANGGNTTETAFSYLAIVGNDATAGQGTWQISDGSGGWITVPTSDLAVTKALIFPSDREVRFVPASDFNGSPGKLIVRLADKNTDLSGTYKISTDATTTFDLTQDGGTSTTGAWNNTDRTLGIMVNAVNDPPMATDDTNSITEDAAPATVSGNVKTGIGGTLDTDIDNTNDQLSITGIRTGTEIAGGVMTAVPAATSSTTGTSLTGQYGTLQIGADGSYTYTVDNTNAMVNGLGNGQSLTDIFTYTLSDLGPLTDTAQLTITINGVDDAAPSIFPIDGNGLDTLGQVTVNESGLTHAGDDSETNTGSLTLAAADGLASITVAGTSVSLAQLTHLTTTSVTIITDEGTITLTGFTPSTMVGGVPTAGTLDYSYTLTKAQTTPSATESPETIALGITDASGKTASGTLTVRIVDDVPTAQADTNSVNEGITAAATTTTGNVFAAGSPGDVADDLGADVQATPVTAVAFGPATGTIGSPLAGAYGNLILNGDGSYTYAVDNTNATVNSLSNGQSLTETFTYTITDKDGDTSSNTLTLTINGRNDPPNAVNDGIFITTEDTPLTNIPVLGNDSDPENNPLTVTSATISPEEGRVTINADGTLNFFPATNFNGTAVITYTISDGQGGTDTATVTITVSPVNDPPVAVNDTGHSPDGRPVTVVVLDNDTDIDGTPLTVSKIAGVPVVPGEIVTIPEGVVTLNTDGTLTFAPNAGVQGNVVFSYEISDGNGGTATADVAITVVPEPTVFPQGPWTSVFLDYTLFGDQGYYPYDDTDISFIRQPIPFSPAMFVHQAVEFAQQERMATDPLYFSNPDMARMGDIESQSIGADLGLDPAVFVQHAVRDSQAESSFINNIVNGRLTRISLSSDRFIPTPELYQPDPREIIPPTNFAETNIMVEHDIAAENSSESEISTGRLTAAIHSETPRSAPSFSEQIRAAGGYRATTGSVTPEHRSNPKPY